MRVMVTGAGGMLGRATADRARLAGHDVTALSRAQLDVTDAAAVREAIERAELDAVINCAAFTDVDEAEANRRGALEVNAIAVGDLARATAAAGVHLIHVSTDYVFAGDAARPYVESDEIDPQSEYGRTKAGGEIAVRDADPGHAIVRTSWLFGVGGRNFVETMLSLGAARGEVRVVTDQRGSPTYAGHLAPALLEIALRRGAGIHHVAASGDCTWNDFAVEIFARAGVDCTVLPTTSDEFPRPARRPAYSVLGSERPDAISLPTWQQGLDDYLRERAGAVPETSAL